MTEQLSDRLWRLLNDASERCALNSNELCLLDEARQAVRRMEGEWLSLKDQYSELARAVGAEGDAWFGDPLESHSDVVTRAEAARSAWLALNTAPVETLRHLGGGHLAAELVLPEVWTALDGQRVRLVAASGGNADG